MIVISDCSKDIVIPAGLGDNAGVVYETAGVKSLNGETGDLKIKTVNGNDMLGDGNIEIKGGVETVNGETGDVKIKTVNGNELTGDGNIEIKAGVESVNGETGAVEVQDLGEYAICALQMSDITLSEADTDVMLWNYGAGKDNGSWSKYMSDDRTLQILLIGTKDRKSYKVPVEIHLMHDGQDNAEMHFTIGDYRYVYSQVSNMHWKFTSKTPVNSGGGSDNVIVLDGLTQEEVKAIYDKLYKTKTSDVVFIYNHSSSFRTYWDRDVLHLIFFDVSYDGIEIADHPLRADGSIGYTDPPYYRYNNSLTLNVSTQINDGADFECEYVGKYYEYIVRHYTRPNSYYILFSNGIGNSTKPVFAPVSVIWDKNYDTDGAGPIRIQFTANEKLYTYLHDSNQENKWLFESAKPIGGVQSSEVSNIKVLSQTEYDALTPKDENVLYCIKG